MEKINWIKEFHKDYQSFLLDCNAETTIELTSTLAKTEELFCLYAETIRYLRYFEYEEQADSLTKMEEDFFHQFSDKKINNVKFEKIREGIIASRNINVKVTGRNFEKSEDEKSILSLFRMLDNAYNEKFSTDSRIDEKEKFIKQCNDLEVNIQKTDTSTRDKIINVLKIWSDVKFIQKSDTSELEIKALSKLTLRMTKILLDDPLLKKQNSSGFIVSDFFKHINGELLVLLKKDPKSTPANASELKELECEEKQNRLTINGLEALNKKVDELEAQNKQNESRIKELEAQNKINESTIKVWETQKKQNASKIKELEEQNEQNRMTISKLEAQNEESRATINKLAAQNKRNESKTKKVEDQNIQNECKIEKLERESRKYKLEIEEWKRRYEESMTLLSRHKEEMDTLKSDTSIGFWERLNEGYFEMTESDRARLRENPSMVMKMIYLCSRLNINIKVSDKLFVFECAKGIRGIPMDQYLKNLEDLFLSDSSKSSMQEILANQLHEDIFLLPGSIQLDPELINFWDYKLQEYQNQDPKISSYNLVALLCILPRMEISKEATMDSKLSNALETFFKDYAEGIPIEGAEEIKRKMTSILLDKERICLGLYNEFQRYKVMGSDLEHNLKSSISKKPSFTTQFPPPRRKERDTLEEITYLSQKTSNAFTRKR